MHNLIDFILHRRTNMRTRTGSFTEQLDLVDCGIVGADYEGDGECTIEYSYTPGSPGCNYLSNGDPGYPEDPAECEILSIVASDGLVVDFDALPRGVQESLQGRGIMDAEENAENRPWSSRSGRCPRIDSSSEPCGKRCHQCTDDGRCREIVPERHRL